MNLNKIEIGAQLVSKQELALKCLEFATQYMLKKKQYRTLNPLSKPQPLSKQNLHSLMAELNSYAFPDLLEKPKHSQQTQIIQKKQLVPNHPKSESKSNRDSSSSKRLSRQNSSDDNTSSINLVFQRVSSEVVQSERSSGGQATSKKGRSKFEKISKQVKKQKQIDKQTKKDPNFTKKPPFQFQSNYIEDDSLIQKKKKSESDDSFQNFPLPLPENPDDDFKAELRLSFNSSDLDSYHSSFMQQIQNKFDVVSEHLSENQESLIIRARNSKEQIKEIVPPDQSLDGIQQQAFVGMKGVQLQDREYQTLDKDLTQNYLISLQSFEIKQQILTRKLAKVWSSQSASIKKTSLLAWRDLNLPRPTFNIPNYQYANIIE